MGLFGYVRGCLVGPTDAGLRLCESEVEFGLVCLM